MSEAFADAAVRLAGMAGAVFGWRPDEFWCATPEELATLIEAIGGGAGGGAIGGWAGTAPPDPATLARLKEAFPDG